MSTPRKPRMAVVGTSHWHHKFYRETIARDAELIAYSDPSQAKIEEVRSLYGDTGHLDWHELLDEKLKLDAVMVLGPHAQMREVCLAFIERKIPIILEKPGGLNADEVADIRRAAEANDVPIAVAFIQRAGNLWGSLKKVGELDYATFIFQSGPPERYINQSPWALERKHAGGGSFINLAVHYIDLFLEATNAKTLTVQGQMQYRLSSAYDVEDRSSALLTTPDGVSAVMEVGYIFPTCPEFRYLSYSARGKDAFMAMDRNGDIAVTSVAGESEIVNANVDSGPLTSIFMAAAIAGIFNRFNGLAGIADLHRTMQIVDAAYESAEKGTAVAVDIAW